MLKIDNLSVGYKNKGITTHILDNIHLELVEGELCTIIGGNGAGKSTLMRTMSGVQKPLSGNVLWKGIDINKFNVSDRSKKLSMVFAERPSTLNLTVKELVSMGRAPYTNWLGLLDDDDEHKIREALEFTALEIFADRKLYTLSDGQKQRAMIARALAQDTSIMILDEPTAHLDLPNRIELFELLRRVAYQSQKAILVSSHELDLAIQFSDKIWMIDTNKHIREGIPEDLICSGEFEHLFSQSTIKFNYDLARFEFVINKIGIGVYVKGEGSMCRWVKHALVRKGFEVCSTFSNDMILVECFADKLLLEYKDVVEEVSNISLLLVRLNSL